MKILGLGGSIRATGKAGQSLVGAITGSNDLNQYIEHVQKLSDARLSNTEIAVGAALVGARSLGAEIEYFPLIQLFPRKESKVEELGRDDLKLDQNLAYIDTLDIDAKKQAKLLSLLDGADGVLFSTPVYFGDRSSVANKFLQITARSSLLKNKVFAALSAGAKRNGGQETANIFSLFEAVNQGAVIVGNGPPHCQYGGTTLAGDLGNVLKDAWGLETCFATGKRVAQAAKLMTTKPQALSRKARVSVLVTMDTPQRTISERIQTLLNAVGGSEVEFHVIELIGGNVYRCLACNICPIPEKMAVSPSGDASYSCIIGNKTDTLEGVRDALLKSDGILVAGANLRRDANIVYRYQAFIERTRFIRRNNFELTNVPIAGLVYSEAGAITNPTHNLKVMTSYLRHNALMLKPIEILSHNGALLYDGKDDLKSFVDQVKTITAKRAAADPIEVQYIAAGNGGYSDSRLDHTKARRR